eukprot:scaffold2508_cov41-Tisochrysis_lutea.AAC.1
MDMDMDTSDALQKNRRRRRALSLSLKPPAARSLPPCGILGNLNFPPSIPRCERRQRPPPAPRPDLAATRGESADACAVPVRRPTAEHVLLPCISARPAA